MIIIAINAGGGGATRVTLAEEHLRGTPPLVHMHDLRSAPDLDGCIGIPGIALVARRSLRARAGRLVERGRSKSAVEQDSRM